MSKHISIILSLFFLVSVSCKKVNQKKSDITPPSGASIVINSGDLVTTTNSVMLSLSAVDAYEMYITTTAECTAGGTWESYSNSKAWTLGQINATATMYAKFRDRALNVSECVSDSITHDDSAPSGGTISINGAATQTNSTSVTLTLSATDANEMYVTNTAGCGSGGTWQGYATSQAWILGQTNGTATVYVKYRDANLNESDCVSDTITHDNTAPTGGSISINGGDALTNSTSGTLTLAAVDASEMYVTNISGCGSGSSWEAYATSKSWTLGQANTTATVYVKYKDTANNETGCFSDTITHDNTAPSGGTVSINGGATYTSSTSVTLTLSSTEAAEMYVSNTSGCGSGGSWEDYNTSKSWTLGQANATATVYVKFRDTATNETSCYNDTIVHDNTAPTGTSISINGGETTTASTSVTLTLGATGASQMYVTNTSGCAGGGILESYATGKAWTLGQTNGTATVYVKYVDAAGNESTCVSDTIVHDDTGPTAGTGISFTNIGDTSVTVNWGVANDASTSTSTLEYKVVKASTSADIDTIAEIDAATTVTDWTSNITSTTATGLTQATTYYFAVLVRDESGNKVLYSPKVRFTGKMIYVTHYPTLPFHWQQTQVFLGSELGGISGADQKCSTYKPPYSGVDQTSQVKAMLVDGTNRRACVGSICTNPSENIDWVLSPNTSYYNIWGDRNRTTNTGGVFVFGSTSGIAQIHNSSPRAWTGLGWNGGMGGDWSTDSYNCGGWTGGNSGVAGDPYNTNGNMTASENLGCSNTYAVIYCVEQ